MQYPLQTQLNFYVFTRKNIKVLTIGGLQSKYVLKHLSRDVSRAVNESNERRSSAVSLRRIKESRFASIVPMYPHRPFNRGIPRIPLSGCRCTLYSYTGFLAIRCRRLRPRRVRRRASGPSGTLSSPEKRRGHTYFENVVTQRTRTEPRRKRRPAQGGGSAKGSQ